MQTPQEQTPREQTGRHDQALDPSYTPGGRCEPVADDFKSSSITLPEGGAYVPGLAEAMKTK
jgi:hypothetical protein